MVPLVSRPDVGSCDCVVVVADIPSLVVKRVEVPDYGLARFVMDGPSVVCRGGCISGS